MHNAMDNDQAARDETDNLLPKAIQGHQYNEPDIFVPIE